MVGGRIGNLKPQRRAAARRASLLALALACATAFPATSNARSSAASYDPVRVLVAFERGVSADSRSAVHGAIGGRVENTLAAPRLDVVHLPRGFDPRRAAARYERSPKVAYAQPNWRVHLLRTPNDALFGQEWGLHNIGQTLLRNPLNYLDTGETAGTPDADIDAPEGWDAAAFGASFPSAGGTRVGVLDTGIDLSHADLLGKAKACATAITGNGIIVQGVCSDDHSHGTHVAGTLGAIADNRIGVAGVAPNADLAIFKALAADGGGFYADVIAGIHWLHTNGGARVISMSIGGPKDKALDKELSEAYRTGTLLIAAAGNDCEGDPAKKVCQTPNYPAFHPDVVSVGATDPDDRHAFFSNCNGDVEVSAPGVDVWSTTPGNTYAPLDGTSMATPHASGVAAMIMWKKQLGAADTRKQLDNTVNDLGPGGRDSCFGHGRVNLARALGATNTTQPPPPSPGAIAGKVTDSRAKAGLGGATVNCGSGGSATTASSGSVGSYSIANVPVGGYTCTASKTGYRSKSQSVTVSSGQTTTANFALRKQ